MNSRTISAAVQDQVGIAIPGGRRPVGSAARLSRASNSPRCAPVAMTTAAPPPVSAGQQVAGDPLG